MASDQSLARSRIAACALLLSLLAPLHAQNHAIPLTVREARPPVLGGGECTLQSGRERTNGPVTFGLPLPAQPATCDTNLLTVDGTAAAQFRVLHRRTDGQCGGQGSIEWLLVDTQVNLAANAALSNLILRSAPPPTPPAALASETATTISVDSGAAVFSIRRQGFNLLDQVNAGGNRLRAGGPGLELIAAGINYNSARDTASEVVIEENGPLRAVVRARGRLQSATGTNYLAYTVRLHFHRNAAQAKAVVSLRNAFVARQENLSFQSFELVVPSTLAAASFTLATHANPQVGTLTAAQTASLIQGENSYPSFRDYDFDDFDGQGNLIRTKWPTLREGYELALQGAPLATGTRVQPIELFYGSLGSGANRITVGTRFAAGWWPQALRLMGNGDLRVGLNPIGNDRVFWARHAGHVTREVLFDFSNTGSAADAMYRFQHPLTGRASSPATYNASGALWEKLVAPSEELQNYLAEGLGTDYPNFFAPVFHIVRHFYWATGGGRNQYDQAKVAATNFLRWDHACGSVAWLHADQKFLYNADLSVYRSDDFDGGRGDVEYFNGMDNIEFIPSARAVFEGEHPHSYGLALWYYLSGDSVQVRDPALAIATRATGVAVLTPLAGARPSNSTSLLCASPQRRIWSTDADNGTLTEIDADTQARLRERQVCGTPRAVTRSPQGQLWLACERSDALVIVDELTLNESARIEGGYGSAPSAVATSPDGLLIFAVFAGRRQVVQYRASDRVEIGRVTLPATPRALAISADSATVLVTRMHAAIDDGQVWRLATGPLRLTTTVALPRFGGTLHADSPASGRGVPNHLVSVAMSPRDGTIWVAANKPNTARGLLVGPDLSADNSVRNLVVGIDPVTNAVTRGIDLDNSDSASSVAFSPLGDYLLVSLQGNNEVLVLDALRLDSAAGLGALVGRFAVGAAPQGVCVDANTGRSFVRNFLGRSVSVLDTRALFERGALDVPRSDVATVGNELLAANVLAGKRLFYHASDRRMSAEGYMSCASCHLDGGSDGRTWDFTGRGEGLRNTVSLHARAGTQAQGNVHWTANFDEIQDFENDIRNAFGGLGFMTNADFAATQNPLGPVKAGRSVDLDALAAYVQSLGRDSLPRSPNRNADGSLSVAGARGRDHFATLGCVGCHSGPNFTNSQNGANLQLTNVGTLRTTSGSRLGAPLTGIDTPTLLGLWESAPYLHDGAADTLDAVFRASGGRVIPAESGSVRAGAVITNQFTEINNDDSVRGRAYVNFNAMGHAVDFSDVDGGAGGVGAIEVRYSASGAGRLDLVVNGVRRSVDIVASGNIPNFRKTRWHIVRLDDVPLTAGSTNSIAVEQATAGGISVGIDEITVSRASDIALTQPHRTALALSAAALADLIEYLLQIDASEGADELFRSGFE